ncbi:unnamed protein product [Acanthoscelides obtectus]|uniref:Uncharacterized protein n=1 Tax=Acanthoscelides obtectus TaxID=200917 RepID=A0A9P0M0D5_ACAOB|nr:unnamed protein product [Acanthoscelides obtectus]CAK1668529.1 hypothetical protein AOBTE_LOCUS26464 [Acanthoscelides obtectus]
MVKGRQSRMMSEQKEVLT